MSGYRRDIDGMRALAIVSVVLCHLGSRWFGGGFVGVDVFFVISGFLIAGIITRELDSGRFSLAHFYERRARRILPALFVMIAFVLAGASLLYMPTDFSEVPKSALMTLAFLANFWFLSRTGYFSADNEALPLLHSWSLAVEGQFYLAMPLLLWVIARWMPRWRVPLLAAAGLLSFAACLWIGASNTDANYFLPVTRAWELIAGALLGASALAPPRRPWQREALAIGGLGLIGFAVLTAHHAETYPGLATVPPVLGTALLLYCAPGTLVGRLLSCKLPVGIGLISYSLYLWHWPIITFASYASVDPLTRWQRIAVLAASLLAAWASWRYVEMPLRNPARTPRRTALGLIGGALAVTGLLAAALLPLGGWQARFPPEVARLDAAAREYDPLKGNCLATRPSDFPEGCRYGAATAPTALVWGDSHSLKLAQALGDERAGSGQALVLRAHSGCLPALGVEKADVACREFNDSVFARLAREPRIERVYLAGNWSCLCYQEPAIVARIDATIARLRAAGKTVVIVGPVPVQPFMVPRQLAIFAAGGGRGEMPGRSAADYERDAAWFTASYPRWRTEGITILDPARALVAGEHTRIIQGGQPLYIDRDHLTMAGARAVLAADPSR